MEFVYPFIISFILIFLSELGDKTQILVLSFSTKNKVSFILLGVALGTLLSHGIAIAFGSKLACISNYVFINYLKFFTYTSFLLFGIIGFIKLKKTTYNSSTSEVNSNSHLIKFLSSLFKNAILLVAMSIAIGELGDKTFLASIGLGVQYPFYKFSLILGAICGMLVSDSLAIFFGKWIGSRISNNFIEILSNLIFILFGVIGFFNFIF